VAATSVASAAAMDLVTSQFLWVAGAPADAVAVATVAAAAEAAVGATAAAVCLAFFLAAAAVLADLASLPFLGGLHGAMVEV
jgi:hypothetical protein